MAKVKTVKVKALVNLKYNKECISIDKEFKVKPGDVEDMVKKGYVEVLEEEEEDETGEGSKDGAGEPDKEG